MNFRQNGDKYLITIEVIALIVVLVLGYAFGCRIMRIRE